MAYKVKYTDPALDHLERLMKHEPKAFAKAMRLIEEVQEHPFTGTGHPEQLKGDLAGQWSRRITSKHRLVYSVHETEIVVLVLKAYGHYNDK